MKDGPIDILSVDLGTNGLCYPEVTAAKLLGYVTDFIQLWLHEGISTKISCPNQVSVQNFSHKMKRFNRSIKDILASYPWASSFSQAKLNFPKYLKDDGCHPNSQGMSRYISIIHSLIIRFRTLLQSQDE